MMLYEMGFPSIAFSSEGIPTKGENGTFVSSIISQLRDRFEQVILFMDNDGPGLNYTKKIGDAYRLKSITIPSNNPKDITDYVAKLGIPKGKKLLKKMISKLFKKDDNFLELAETVGRNIVHGPST